MDKGSFLGGGWRYGVRRGKVVPCWMEMKWGVEVEDLEGFGGV